jgi:DNA-directed RNA polymerase specialized sigma subunit
MSIQRGNLKELYELSNIVEELDRKVLEAIKMAEERGLMQVARVLGTIKSYVDLLRRELEVKDQL